jgi:DNA-binding response OmpR family regulator
VTPVLLAANASRLMKMARAIPGRAWEVISIRFLGRKALGEIMAKILVVEDDVECADLVKKALVNNKNEVDVVHEGHAGLEWLSSQQYDIAIVDWELPGMSGMDLCRSFRSKRGETRILLLTGRNKVDDRIQGLDSGADDYLTKPFNLGELLARVRALLRRPVKNTDPVLEVGNVTLDPALGTVTCCDQVVPLTRKEYLLLDLLMRNVGSTVLSERIVNSVWNTDSEVTGDAVRCVVTRLKGKLDAVKSSKVVIKNVYGMGYRLEEQ